MGGIQQILQSDWFRDRAEFSHPAFSWPAEAYNSLDCVSLGDDLKFFFFFFFLHRIRLYTEVIFY